MSLLGHFRPIDDVCAMSAFPPIATELPHYGNGRSKPCQFQVPDNAHSVRSVRLAYRLSASTRADAPLAQMRPDLAADKIQLSRRKRLGDLAGAVNEKLGQAGSAFDRNPMHGDFQRKNA
jgi:hypothetical protein